ncbi:flagellar protein FlgN [Paenibacillaceae bacterium]|nr:flagellar protein FlgN [Paenibacillaceae bacterium]
MNDKLQVIIDTLEELTGLHRQLIVYSKEKQEAIAANRTDLIAAVATRESKVIQRVGDTDRRRLLAVGEYVAKLGFTPTGTFRMEQLVQMVYIAEEKQQLRAACTELSQALAQLREINDFNQQMIKLNLEYISCSLDLLAGPSEDEATYHRSLQAEGFKRRSQFDTKA